MTFDEFNKSLAGQDPQASLDPLLIALWYDAKGDWKKAHNVAQEIDSSDGAWVHAYLHRKEGDNANARYWYNRAKRPMPTASLQSEWKEIVTSLLLKK